MNCFSGFSFSFITLLLRENWLLSMYFVCWYMVYKFTFKFCDS
uniref:Uncharacterized protein n=1 Tax=Anguilla anguilla TaxID=7936 RepID=A0A0E9QVD0_ANGAN